MLLTTSLFSFCLFICCSAVAILPFRSREFSRRTPRFRTSFTIVARHWALGAIPCVFSIATPWPLSGEVLACPRTTADCLVLGKEIQPMAITPKRFTLVLTFIAIVGVSCLLLSAQQKSVSVEGYVEKRFGGRLRSRLGVRLHKEPGQAHQPGVRALLRQGRLAACHSV